MRRASGSVGARELKTRLGTYLRRVQEGRRLVVTERGRPVAELRPVGAAETGVEAALARLESLGLLTRPAQRALSALRPIRARGRTAAQAVLEGREDRF